MNDQQRDPMKETHGSMNTGIGLMQALAMPGFVWWTKFGTAGEFFFGGRLSVIGWLLLPLFPMCLMPCDLRPMYVFWGLTTLLLLVHRVRHWQLLRRGCRPPHSHFMGFTRMAWPGRWRPHGATEAALTSFLGFVVLGPDKALGCYLIVAGFAMAISIGYAGEVQRSILRRINDARRDQEWMAEQMREEE
jgi:hypothetical protein